MARKVITVAIDKPGRDFGKTFVLTEMSAVRAEKWAIRALLALMAGNPDIPDNIASLGLAGLAMIGIQALGGLDPLVAEPLLDEMMACVTFRPDPSKEFIRPLVVDGVNDDIEDVKTLLLLRKKILELHVEFFTDADLLQSVRAGLATK